MFLHCDASILDGLEYALAAHLRVCFFEGWEFTIIP
jgi:hypothetical protein